MRLQNFTLQVWTEAWGMAQLSFKTIWEHSVSTNKHTTLLQALDMLERHRDGRVGAGIDNIE